MRKLGGYLRPETAARYLGIPIDEVQKMIEGEELPRVKINGEWRVPLDQLEQWLDEEVTAAELKKLARRLKSLDPGQVDGFIESATDASQAQRDEESP